MTRSKPLLSIPETPEPVSRASLRKRAHVTRVEETPDDAMSTDNGRTRVQESPHNDALESPILDTQCDDRLDIAQQTTAKTASKSNALFRELKLAMSQDRVKQWLNACTPMEAEALTSPETEAPRRNLDASPSSQATVVMSPTSKEVDKRKLRRSLSSGNVDDSRLTRKASRALFPSIESASISHSDEDAKNKKNASYNNFSSDSAKALIEQLKQSSEESRVPPEQILSGVVAMVDVRTGHDNRTRSIQVILRSLGAEVVSKLNKSVTHLVFKDGSLALYRRAQKLKLHIVSVSWIEACKIAGKRLNEKDFPSVSKEKYESPVYVPRLRKFKSFQPLTMEEVHQRVETRLQRAAARAARKKPREGNTLQGDKISIAMEIESAKNIEEAQAALVQGSSSKSANPLTTKLQILQQFCDEPLLGSQASCDDLLRKEITKLDAQKSEKELSSEDEINIPLAKRVFKRYLHEAAMSERKRVEKGLGEEPFSGTCASAPRLKLGSGKEMEEESEGPINKKQPGKKVRLESPPTTQENAHNVSTCSSTGSSQKSNEQRSKKKHRLFTQPKSLMEDSPTFEFELPSQPSAFKTPRNRVTLPKAKLVTTQSSPMSGIKKIEYSNGKPGQKKDEPAEQRGARSARESSSIEKPSCPQFQADPSTCSGKTLTLTTCTSSQLHSHAVEINRESSKTEREIHRKGKFNYNDPPVNRKSKGVAKSENKASVARKRAKKLKATQESTFKTTKKENNQTSNSVVKVGEKESSVKGIRRQKVEKEKVVGKQGEDNLNPLQNILNKNEDLDRRRSSADFEKARLPRPSAVTKPRQLVIAALELSPEDEGLMRQLVSHLGKFVLDGNLSRRTTHVVCPPDIDRSNLELLQAMLQGCWILSQKWLFASVERNDWVPEDDFELTSISAAVRTYRLQREMLVGSKKFQSELLSQCGSLFIHSTCSKLRRDLVKLARLAGAQIEEQETSADIIIAGLQEHIGNENKRRNRKRVYERTAFGGFIWVTDGRNGDYLRVERDFISMSGSLASSSFMATSPTDPEAADQKEDAPFSTEWSVEELQCLRLCRNRACAKANDRRRRHVSVSMAAFMQREWRILRPNSTWTGKDLLQMYKLHFEKKPASVKVVVGEKRSYPETGDDENESTKTKTARTDEFASVIAVQTNSAETKATLEELPRRKDVKGLSSNSVSDAESHLMTPESRTNAPPPTYTFTGLLSKELLLSTEGKASFRHWTSRMMLDLLNLAKELQTNQPELQSGCPDFNTLLLKRFQEAHPSCIESRRSLFLKLQTLNKELAERNSNNNVSHNPKELKRTNKKRISTNTVKAIPSPGLKLVTKIKEEKTSDRENGCSTGVVETTKGNNSPSTCAISTERKKDHVSRASVNENNSQELQVKKEESGASTLDSQCKTEFPGESLRKMALEGFEDWSLQMIRDFIASMDTARKRYAALKQSNDDGKLRLVPLVHEEWLRLYPQSTETVRSVLVKIKLLKSQKDVIKEHLRADTSASEDSVPSEPISRAQKTKSSKARPSLTSAIPASARVSGASAKISASSALSEFKWHKDMIEDVVHCRQKALMMKKEQRKKEKTAKQGKVSFHSLWEQLFREKYPNSHFTANNLSVHFWSWRKQQQKLGKADPIKEESLSLSAKHPARDPESRGGDLAFESTRGMKHVAKTMRFKRSQNDASQRVLNLSKKYIWTPRNNLVLRECAEECNFDKSKTLSTWREHFPFSDHTDRMLIKRLDDLQVNCKGEGEENNETYQQLVRAPNIPDHMHWSERHIDDLFAAHCKASEHRRGLMSDLQFANRKGRLPTLSQLFHREFLQMHPNCKLSASELLKKLNALKTSRGTAADQAERDNKNQRRLNLVMESRRRALLQRRESLLVASLTHESAHSSLRVPSLLAMWHREFRYLCHLEGVSYSSSAMKLVEDYDEAIKDRLLSSPIAVLKKDVFLHMKNIVEGTKIYLPPFVPPFVHPRSEGTDHSQEQQLFTRHESSLRAPLLMPQLKAHVLDQQPNIRHGAKPMEEPSTESVHNNTIKLPGGATLMAVALGKDDHERGQELFRAKANERPHVTITLGSTPSEDNEMPVRGVMVPPPMAALATRAAPPPPLPQLKPYGLDPHRFFFSLAGQCSQPARTQLPRRFLDRLLEYGLTEAQFDRLIQVYNETLSIYEKSLCDGFLVFFPYLLQANWHKSTKAKAEENSFIDDDRSVSGRRLAYLMELYAQEVHAAPGCLVKASDVQSNIERSFFTEQLIQDLVLLRQEIVVDLCDNEALPMKSIDAIVDAELHRRWHQKYDVSLTFNQILGVSRTMKFEEEKESKFNGSRNECDLLNLEVETKLVQLWCEMNDLVQDSLSATDMRMLVDEANKQINPKGALQQPNYIKNKRCNDMSTMHTLDIQHLLSRCRNLSRGSSLYRLHGRTQVSNLPRFWTEQRLEHLLVCYSKALSRRRRILRRHKWAKNKRNNSLENLLKGYWSLGRGTKHREELNGSLLLGKAVRQVRWARKEVMKKLDRKIRIWKEIVNEYELGESITSVDEHQYEDIVTIDDYGSTSMPAWDFSLDSEVLTLISESQQPSSPHPPLPVAMGWSSGLMNDLIKARRRARGRKRRWESWAIKEYGSLTAAYCKSNIKVDKIDDLFMEEWAKIRPELARLSIWTLNAHARKFDLLKKALIQNANSYMRKGEIERARIQYWDHSGVPQFNLESLATDNRLDKTIVALVKSRQEAMIKRSSKLSFFELWKNEYNNCVDTSQRAKNGYELARSLHAIEHSPKFAKILAAHVISSQIGQSVPICQSGVLTHEEALHPLRPRQRIFDNDEVEMQVCVELHQTQKFSRDEDDNLMDFELKKCQSALPAVVPVHDEEEEEDEIKLASKLSQLLRRQVLQEKVKLKQGNEQSLKFHNINNRLFQEALSEEVSHEKQEC